MSWGPISAASDKPNDLEKVLNETATAYFDNIGHPEVDDSDSRAQAKAAAAAAKVLMENLEFRGSVNIAIAGHFGNWEVPSGISINLVDLNPPDPPVEPEDRETAVVE